MKLVVKTHLASADIDNIEMFRELYDVLYQLQTTLPDIAVGKAIFTDVMNIASKTGISAEQFAHMINRDTPKIVLSNGESLQLDTLLPLDGYEVRGLYDDLEVDIDFYNHSAFVDKAYSVKFEISEDHWIREYLPEEDKQNFLINP